MVPALPPSPPAIVMQGSALITFEAFVLIFDELSKISAPLPLFVDRHTVARPSTSFGIGFKLGPKTRGARDASRRCRSQRRKARG